MQMLQTWNLQYMPINEWKILQLYGCKWNTSIYKQFNIQLEVWNNNNNKVLKHPFLN
jgi:hypothetical protein